MIPNQPPSAAGLRASLDEAAAIDLWRRAVARESITGNEANFADLLEAELRELGVTTGRRDFAPGRPNVWGERKGTGEGPRLLFMGHTDTVHVRGWREHWKGTEREDPFGGAIVDGALWGRGSGDLKAGICASLAALRLLDAAGVELAGDVGFAFIGDEESGEPGMGLSEGAKDYVALCESGEVARPDFAIYVEPTQLAVYPVQMGFLIADITITGKSAYFGVPELGKDALKAAHGVLSALWRHSDELAGRGTHPLIGRSFLLVTEIKSGGYIAVPGECSLSLIRKLRPGESLDAAAGELEHTVRDAVTDPEIAVVVDFPAGRDHPLGGSPTETDADLLAIAALRRRLDEVLPGRGSIDGAPYWSEAPFLVDRLGVPTVYCAPGDIRNCHTLEEHVSVEEYLAGIVAFAAFIADFCGTVAINHVNGRGDPS
ncbi:MAG: M20/M25/M40 family metallo-hydrolase [Pseudomonadota bacterium]